MQFRNQFRGLATMTVFLAALAGAGPAASQVGLLSGQWGAVPGEVATKQAPIILAQADPRLISLEEQIRQLNGRMEELNFQILQMQDQMRRMQEDAEFRFQELEGKGASGGASAPDQKTERQVPAAPAMQGTDTAAVPATPPPGVAAGTAPLPPGEPPRTLGTITFDEKGNVVSDGGGQPIDLLQGTPAGTDQGAIVAALPPSDDPAEIYRNAYEFILSGDYRTAEAGFRQYLDRFPDGPQAADANFWLGEAMLGQERHREAAEVFLQANRTYPDSTKAPDMLLKLGVSLAALDQRDVACATFAEVGQRYPNASSVLMERVKQEQAAAGC